MSPALLLAFFSGFTRGLAPAPRVVRRPRNVLARPALPPAVDLEDQEQALVVARVPRLEVFTPPQSVQGRLKRAAARAQQRAKEATCAA